MGGGQAFGQAFPNKPIRIYTAPAGGGADFVSRIIAQETTAGFGQPVVVDNRPSLTLPNLLMNSAPDGYSLALVGASFWIAPLLENLNYDVPKDMSAVCLVARDVFILVVHPSLPVKSVKELIAFAKARPGQLNYGTTNIGGPRHLGMELLKSLAGVNIVAVPYQGSPAALIALASGEVQASIVDVALGVPYIKSGKVRALAVTSANPTPLAPGLPPVAAGGVPGYELTGYAAILAPKNTPAAVITRLNQEIVRAITKTDVKEKLLITQQQEVIASTPQELESIIKTDLVKWDKVIRDAKLKQTYK